MKHIQLFVSLLLLGTWAPQRACAQAPAWQSARVVALATAAATTNYSAVTATAVDAGGNVYLAGNFKGNVLVGSIPLSSVGGDDVFVAKFNPASNQFVWAQRAGSAGNDAATALAMNGTSVYVAGFFRGATAVFGPTTLPNPAPGTDLGFLASLTDLTLAAASAALPREPAALFPNPAQASTTLRRPAGAGAAALTLTDARGRTVRRYPAPAGPTDTALDLGGLPAGLYLLRGAGPALRLAVE